MKIISLLILTLISSCAFYRVELKVKENYNHHEENYYNKDIQFPIKAENIYSYYNSINHKPILIDSIMLFMTSNGKLTALNLLERKTKDSYKFNFGTDIAPIIKDNFLLITIEHGNKNILKYDLNTNNFIWDIDLEYGIETKPIIDENLVYIVELNGIVSQIDFVSGEKKWKTKLNKFSHSNPTHNNNIMYVADDSGTITALNKANGEIIWTKNHFNTTIYSPLLYMNNMIIAADIKGNIFSINALSGEINWSIDAVNPIFGEFAVDNEHAYIGVNDGKILKILPEDGSIDLTIKRDQIFNAQPLIGEKYIYIGGGEGKFYIFDKKNGKEMYMKQFKGRFISSPLFWKDNLIVFSDADDINLLSKQ